MGGKDLIQYIIAKAAEDGRLLSRTALVKIIYLLDYLSMQKHNEKLTSYSYDYYYYGPFSQEIIKDLNSLIGGSVVEKTIHFPSGKVMYSYETSPHYENVPLNVDPSLAEFINFKVSEYLDYSLGKLKEAAYNTPPIKDNPKGKEHIL